MNGKSKKLYYTLWLAGGAISLLLTLCGGIASLIFDYRKLGEVCLALCLVLPFPSFMIGLRSLRWSAILLWFTSAALSLTRANIRPNPEPNPVDALGTLYLLPAIAVQLATFFAPKKNAAVVAE